MLDELLEVLKDINRSLNTLAWVELKRRIEELEERRRKLQKEEEEQNERKV